MSHTVQAKRTNLALPTFVHITNCAADICAKISLPSLKEKLLPEIWNTHLMQLKTYKIVIKLIL